MDFKYRWTTYGVNPASPGRFTPSGNIPNNNHLLLPNNLKDWAARLSAIQDADIRQEFFGIQSEFAEIIHQDVLRTSEQFYLRYQPSNSEIETTLQMQADNDRDFMTITTDGGFIHISVPELSRK